jgi:hypothetical protein
MNNSAVRSTEAALMHSRYEEALVLEIELTHQQTLEQSHAQSQSTAKVVT